MPKKSFVPGEVLRAADVNTYLTESKNVLINGNFSINQRGFTSTTTSGVYGFDRWTTSLSGGTVTYSKQSFTPGVAPVAEYEAASFARLVVSGQSAVSDVAILSQRVEDVRTLSGQSVTVSFWAKAASGTPKVAVELQQNFGSGGSPSATVSNYVGQVTLGTGWARYSVSMNLPSLSGKTFGTDVNSSFLALQLFVSAGSNFNSRTGSIGTQNNTFDFWGIQLEEGSTATPFSPANNTIQGELAACQRYYYQTDASGSLSASNAPIGMAVATANNVARMVMALPVSMRIAPSAVGVSSVTGFNLFGVSTQDTTNVQISGSTPEAVFLTLTTGATMTAGQAYVFRHKAATDFISYSVEL